MNEYKKQAISLAGGLDFSTDAVGVSAGALADCYNFEAVDYVGYKRVDGFERFDGTQSPSALQEGSSLKTITVSTYECVPDWPTLLLTYPDGLPSGTVLTDGFGGRLIRGYVVSSTGPADNDEAIAGIPVVIVYQETYPDSIVDLLSVTARYEGSNILAINDNAVVVTPASASTTIAVANQYYTDISANKTKFKQSRIAHALHYYKESLHAVVDFEHILVTQSDANANRLTFGNIYPGDIVYSGSTKATVLDVRLVTGSWGVSGTGTTCEAKLLVQRYSDVTSDPIFAASTEIGVERNTTGVTDIMTVVSALSTTAPSTWQAGLYRARSEMQANNVVADQGWQQITHPWEFEYTEGYNANGGLQPEELIRKYRLESYNPEDAATVTTYDAGATVGTDGTASPKSGFYTSSASNLETVDASYAFVAGNTFGGMGIDCSATITGFDFSAIPENAVITGIEAQVVGRLTTDATTALPAITSTPPSLAGILLVGGDVTGENKGSTALTFASDAVENTYNFGGTYDKWGIADLGATVVRSSDFGVKVVFSRPQVSAALANVDILAINRIVLRVSYTQPSTKYYFWNGTNDVSADVIRVHTAKNAWNDSALKAEGSMIVANVTPVASATRNNILLNDEMRTATGGGGTLLCKVKNHMVVCATASLSQIVEAKSRFEIITENYYGDATWEAMYGVSGAGRAFSYDGTYFQKIYTGVPIEKDKPRHVRSYNADGGVAARLALGFPSSSVLFSVAGEPESFDGVNGAQEIAIGSPVLGLANMNGTTLGVFCANKVVGIQGLTEGSPLVSLRPKGGAIEYTVQEVGNDVFFCDVYGVHSLLQTDAYGDFTGKPLSSSVSSWLQPRLRTSNAGTQIGDLGVVLASLIVRHKNQYRLFFRDGYVLTLTMKGQERMPEFTIQRYMYTSSGTDYIFVPIALSSDIDEVGRERLFMSHYAAYADATDAINTQDAKRYVFEIDRGWSFDNNVIVSYFTPYYNFFDKDVFQYKILRKARLYGLSRNVGTLTLYSANAFDAVSNVYGQDISLTSGTTLVTVPRNHTALTNLADRGITVSLKFAGSTTTIEPPMIAQSLFLHYDTGSADE
jgi:hypothetical protein